MAPAGRLSFWFEFASTYSYPAALRLPGLAAGAGIAIEWRPFLLGPLFSAQGWNDSPFNLYPAKGRYMWRDLTRICARHRLPFMRPSAFPRNGLTAARIACAASAEPWLPDFVGAVFGANFAQDRDISDPAVLAECLAGCGAQPRVWLARADTAATKSALRSNTARAAELDIFGAPSFIVGTELFWGHDRLEQALAWASEHPGLASAIVPAHDASSEPNER
jgi:2-hydroxychromene-2-carboxylate isomerase